MRRLGGGPGGLRPDDPEPPYLEPEDLELLLLSSINKVWKKRVIILASPWKNSVRVPTRHSGLDSRISPRSLMYGILIVFSGRRPSEIRPEDVPSRWKTAVNWTINDYSRFLSSPNLTCLSSPLMQNF